MRFKNLIILCDPDDQPEFVRRMEEAIANCSFLLVDAVSIASQTGCSIPDAHHRIYEFVEELEPYVTETNVLRCAVKAKNQLIDSLLDSERKLTEENKVMRAMLNKIS